MPGAVLGQSLCPSGCPVWLQCTLCCSLLAHTACRYFWAFHIWGSANREAECERTVPVSVCASREPWCGGDGFLCLWEPCSSWFQSHRKTGKLHIHQLGMSCSLSCWRLPRDAFFRAWFWQGAWYPVHEQRKLMNGGEGGKQSKGKRMGRRRQGKRTEGLQSGALGDVACWSEVGSES